MEKVKPPDKRGHTGGFAREAITGGDKLADEGLSTEKEMKKFMKISDVAKELHVAVVTVHRHLGKKKALLRDHVKKESGVTTISTEGIEILRRSIEESSVKPKPAETTQPAPVIAPDNGRLDALEKSMMLLADEVASQRKTIAMQEEKIVFLQSRAEIPVLLLSSPPRPVKPWHPVRIQPVPMPWYERLWLQMFNPETLREATE